MKVCAVIACLVMTVVVPNIHCRPGGYDGSFGGGIGGYGGTSGGGGGGSGYRGYTGSLASDALKNSYNNFDGYNFNFGYDVEDAQNNNYQSRQESGSADPKGQVTGSYSVLAADGNRRTVDYVADWVNGFRATVRDNNGVTQYGYNTDGGDGSYVESSGGSGGYGGSAEGNNGGHGGSSGGSAGGNNGGHGGSSGGSMGGANGGYGGNSAGSSGKY